MTVQRVLNVTSGRRAMIKGSVAAAATVAGVRAMAVSAHDEGTPEAGGNSILGGYCVVRSYTIVPEKDVNELIDIVSTGFVDIVSQVDGFEQYMVVFNDETRRWSAINIFDNKDGADASSTAAADYVKTNDIASFLADSAPEIVDGTVVVAATADMHDHHEDDEG